MLLYRRSSSFPLLSTGAISNDTSLFTYDSARLQDSYLSFTKHHDPDFVPAFSLPESPGDPLLSDVLEICVGNGANLCKYDSLATRSLRVGNATMSAYRSHAALVNDLTPGRPTTVMGIKAVYDGFLWLLLQSLFISALETTPIITITSSHRNTEPFDQRG